MGAKGKKRDSFIGEHLKKVDRATRLTFEISWITTKRTEKIEIPELWPQIEALPACVGQAITRSAISLRISIDTTSVGLTSRDAAGPPKGE